MGDLVNYSKQKKSCDNCGREFRFGQIIVESLNLAFCAPKPEQYGCAEEFVLLSGISLSFKRVQFRGNQPTSLSIDSLSNVRTARSWWGKVLSRVGLLF